MIKTLRSVWQRKFNRWLDKRIPPQTETQLSHNSIFIFPGRLGLMYLILCGILFVLGTNYQNNLILFSCYFLLSVFLLSIVSAYRNFQSLHFRFGHINDVYAQQRCLLPVWIEAHHAQGELICRFEGHKDEFHIDLPSHEQRHQLDLLMPYRGIHSLPRVRFSLSYPFGLIRCWTLLAPNLAVVVYPEPLSCGFPPPLEIGQDATSTGSKTVTGQEDFDRLRAMQHGEPRSHIAWKALAQGKGLFTKQFNTNEHRAVVLELTTMPGKDDETKLQQLSFLVTQSLHTQRPFVFKLNGHVLGPDSSHNHCIKCLRMLAECPRD